MDRAQEPPAEATARRLRRQAVACQHLGSPLYAGLLDHAADDLLAGGPVAEVLAGHLTDPWRSALGLRMLGGVHALVLTGQAPGLSCYYASAGGTADPGPGCGRAWGALQQVLAAHRDAVRSWLNRPPQTNEVGRSAALIGGLRHVTAEAALPVRLVEIGASAGLNLRADRFCVAGDAGRYGAAATPSARFAWLALEPHRRTADGECLVTLTTWPGGEQRVLGTAPPHGLPVTWSRPAGSTWPGAG